MSLVSPGVQVSIIDQSQYIGASTNSVPYILLATAQNKISGAGVGVAAGTLAANANKLYLITSQRDLLSTFGNPFFYTTTAGTPINGYELNEYGLLAAYSALGVTNQCFVQRADVDLAELTATLIRPTGSPNNGTYWLDTANTVWGIFQWNLSTGAFVPNVPLVITNTNQLYPSSTVPLPSVGSIGNYAVVANNQYNPIYNKRGGPTTTNTNATALSDVYNTWVQVGSDDWLTSWPTVTGSTSPTSLTAGNTLVVNGVTVTVPNSPNNTVTGLSNAINNLDIPGVYTAYFGNTLSFYCNSETQSDGSTLDTQGTLILANGSGTPLTTLGITAGTYSTLAYFMGPNTQQPRWNSSGSTPKPTGSVYIKDTNVNQGTYIVMKKFDSTLGAFVQQACPVYSTEEDAIYALDPSGGGYNIPAGSTYALANPTSASDAITPLAGLLVLERLTTGETIVTAADEFTDTDTPFTPGDEFTLTYSVPNTNQTVIKQATIGGTGTTADFCDAVSGATIVTAPSASAAEAQYVNASVNSSGALVFTHTRGGDIILANTTGTPIADAGFNTTCTGVRLVASTGPSIVLSNWVGYDTFQYTVGTTAPDQDPVNGRLWYYSATNQADIMIQNNGEWFGYQNVDNDVRGYDLTETNATGPIFSTTAPTTQTNVAQSPLVPGDLWIDTSDLENYPVISRWEIVNSEGQWVLIDNTDQTTENGILFADARWAPNATTNPVTDTFPTITSLLTSDYLDFDAPEPTLYPQGTLLFNTRRSGFNVKRFAANYFTPANFPGESSYPDASLGYANTWITDVGNKNDGSPYMGRLAQRQVIVEALKSGVDTSTTVREEQNVFNLMACPSYPELMTNLIVLNNDRNNTAFIVGDTPLRLAPADVVAWSSNNNGLGLPSGDGLSAYDTYAGTFYPSCQTTDLTGNLVVTAPSHMMVRTIIRSDSVSYPWLAPAGTRRGVVDNAIQLGYVNAQTGEFDVLGVGQGLRDVLYQNSINPITFIPGVGITNFGNKTTTQQSTAMNRINVARLVAFIRGRLETIGKQYLFEPNDQITRNSISNTINSLMIDLVSTRGIYDYLVVCDLSNNTPSRIDNNELWVDIAIEPVKAVEFIYIPVRIMNTGAIAAGLVA